MTATAIKGLTGLVCGASLWLIAPLRGLTGLACALAPKRATGAEPPLPRTYRCGDPVAFVHAAFKQRFNGKIVEPAGRLWFVRYKWPDGSHAITLCDPSEFAETGAE